MATHDVSIELAGGNVVVTPGTVKPKRGDDVVWDSDHPFIVFVEESGSHGRPTQGGIFGGKSGAKATAKIRDNAPNQNVQYKYDVAVWDEAAGEMRGVDPTIMVVPS